MTTATAIDFRQARFLSGAANFRQCPPDEGVEVAFCGRSNAGKSSAINRIAGQQKLARTSKTPGRTQHINFFGLDDSRRLVDLPGYGFAKVPLAIKQRWEVELSTYLHQRGCLRGLVLVSDIRRELTDADRNMLSWASEVALPVHVLLTKADKLRPGAARQSLLRLERQFADADNVSLQLFSALSGTGLEQARRVLSAWYCAPRDAV